MLQCYILYSSYGSCIFEWDPLCVFLPSKLGIKSLAPSLICSDYTLNCISHCQHSTSLVLLTMARTHKPDISPTTRGRVYQCILDKKTYRNIAAQFNISLGEISSLKKRFEKRGHLRTAPRSGRPHVLTDRSERHVASLMRRGKASNASALKRNYYPDISVWTIRCALNKAGLRAYRPRKVPHLNKIQRQVRKVWATKLKAWDFRHWECLFFSDEAKFNVYRSDSGEKIWRERRKAYNPKYTLKPKKFGNRSVICWGCITPWGVE